MVGGMRNVRSRYARPREEPQEQPEGLGSRSRSRSRHTSSRRTRSVSSLQGETPAVQQQETPTWEQEEQEEMTTGAHEEQEEEEEEEEEEEDEDDGAPPDIWQRGPSQLPNRSIFIDHRTLIRPRGQKSFKVLVAGVAHQRHPSTILGGLCRLHFPGVVTLAGAPEPAWTFQHYGGTPDTTDVLGRNFGNKALRVIKEMWDFFRVEPEYEEQANHIFGTKCVKSIKDMHYEARIQAIINYKAQYEHVKIHKDVAKGHYTDQGTVHACATVLGGGQRDVLGNDGGLVVQPGMAGPARRSPRATQKDVRSITPSREPYPRGIQRKI
ncbi:uncharacterized protein LOC8071000 isoform X1 [Sorghum bicolor]|uniref:uncharacterized protein LOC8071000 isoform X1 n=1 Tax=Sorghum bicolor TaxID=4558 RepID=UPI000B426717|nr:uncharacterized protein LOC8071000 isoform X1 [Sorghum bicolor]XP_021320255.1 uncharacterized protein LOC8071000 isoform X1 [Sorghum bicolor]XP_021320256.1 uncharacterized protein LOC8071000 isoform X1 [Sorghum bicolor]|eukprot:XP_021320254.1 uncharacterized protein LOC8071000 isoform X1 [Sorghum bicolor]